MQSDDLAHVCLHLGTVLDVGGTFLVQVTQLDESVQILGFALDLLGDLDYPQLNQ